MLQYPNVKADESLLKKSFRIFYYSYIIYNDIDVLIFKKKQIFWNKQVEMMKNQIMNII